MEMFVEPKCIYLHRDAVDFRKSIDGLVAIVEGELERDAYTGALFLFCNKALLATSVSVKTEKAKPKRRPLPAQLPRVEVVVDLDESDKKCDCCQSPLHKMDESSSEALEFVPAHIKVIKTITTLMSATAISKSIATPSLLSQIIMCKYQFGLPLYRQETLFADIGIELSRQTMSSWMLRCADLLFKRGVVISSRYSW